jgi:hypothetical protein
MIMEGLVEEAATFNRTTKTRNLVLLERKVIVWRRDSVRIRRQA